MRWNGLWLIIGVVAVSVKGCDQNQRKSGLWHGKYYVVIAK